MTDRCPLFWQPGIDSEQDEEAMMEHLRTLEEEMQDIAYAGALRIALKLFWKSVLNSHLAMPKHFRLVFSTSIS